MTMRELVCRVCQHPRSNHPFRHPFTALGDSTAWLGGNKGGDSRNSGNSAQREPEVAQWPFDPVLRQTLINKGVITPEDLRAAEDQIKAVTAQFDQTVRSSRHGESTEETWGREIRE